MLEAYEGGVQDVYCFLSLHGFFQERSFRVCGQILIKYCYQVDRKWDINKAVFGAG